MKRVRPGGLTLLELAIVMPILAILLAIGIPTLGNHMANQQVRSQADRVEAMLRLARTAAANGTVSASPMALLCRLVDVSSPRLQPGTSTTGGQAGGKTGGPPPSNEGAVIEVQCLEKAALTGEVRREAFNAVLLFQCENLHPAIPAGQSIDGSVVTLAEKGVRRMVMFNTNRTLVLATNRTFSEIRISSTGSRQVNLTISKSGDIKRTEL